MQHSRSNPVLDPPGHPTWPQPDRALPPARAQGARIRVRYRPAGSAFPSGQNRATTKHVARSIHTSAPQYRPATPAAGSRPQSAPSHHPANDDDPSARPEPRSAKLPSDQEPPSSAQFVAPQQNSRKINLQDGIPETLLNRNDGVGVPPTPHLTRS
jgi:hypothetical protein